MVEFTTTGEELWNRMERAVETVNDRLRKTVGILEAAKVPYAVIGGHAVRAWVAQVDEAALRTTRDVEPTARAGDFQTVELKTLVRMKLNAFRRKDQVHLLDMISPGLIDATWLDRYPEQLRFRLEELLIDPDD